MGREHTFFDAEFRTGRYDAKDQGVYTPNLVGVMMPYQSDDDQAVYSVIKTECEKLGLTPKRADDFRGSGMVLREITFLIEACEFVICDLTCERPNVYYELGYAHGVGNEAMDILLIAKAGTELHFDIAPLRVHEYTTLSQLGQVVFTNLEEMIRVTRQSTGSR